MDVYGSQESSGFFPKIGLSISCRLISE